MSNLFPHWTASQFLNAAGMSTHADRDLLLTQRDILVRASNMIHHGFDCQSDNSAHSRPSFTLQPRNSSVDRLIVPANMRPLNTITEGSESRWFLMNASRANSSTALTDSRAASSVGLDPFVVAMEQVLAQMVSGSLYIYLTPLYIVWGSNERGTAPKLGMWKVFNGQQRALSWPILSSVCSHCVAYIHCNPRLVNLPRSLFGMGCDEDADVVPLFLLHCP